VSPLELSVLRSQFGSMQKTLRFKRHKEKQFVLQMGRCFYCREKFYEDYQIIKAGVVVNRYRHIEVDHIVSLSKGGTNDYSNLVLSCQPCNLEKEKEGWVNPRG